VSEPQKDERAPPPLPYARGTYTPPTLLKAERYRLLGGILTGFVFIGFVSGTKYAAFTLNRIHIGFPSLREMQVTLVIGIVVGVLLPAIGLEWRRAVKRRDNFSSSRFPLAQGLLIGAGIACLVFSGCYGFLV
jgi:hypothetical protein